MPLFYQHNINEHTKLGIWKIEEPEDFFLRSVPLQREITHPHKRLQHLAGRYLLTFLFPDFPYEEIVIADTRKPYLPYEQYHFSISHCGDFAAAVVSSKMRTGVDIELATEKILRIANKFLNEKETGFFEDENLLKKNKKQFEPLSLTGGNDKVQFITILWSAKEAIYKWWSYGSVDFSKHILLQPFQFDDSGSIDARFLREEEMFSLQLQYKIFDSMCLVWLVTDP